MTTDTSDSSIANRKLQIANLLARPAEQRRREYKYRFSQSVVFGLPVIALQLYGSRLGPTDWERWVSLLQLLLAGWVLYVNLGMFFEGVVKLWWRQWSWDLPVVTLAGCAYGYSAVAAAAGIISTDLPYRPLFDGCVALLAVWTGWQWFCRSGAAPSSPPPGTPG